MILRLRRVEENAAMTFRALLIGLLGAALISALEYLSRYAWPLGLSFDTHMPASVFGPLVVAVLAINPLLFLLRRSLRFQAGETATILALCLAGCGISGWIRTLTRAIGMPIQYNQTEAGWRKLNLLGYLPPAVMPERGQFNPQIMDGFLTGLGREGHPIGLSRIPWQGWIEPLSVWVPLILLTGMATVGLSLVIHRQWSTHERLRYPIAEFGTSLMAQPSQGALGRIFRDKLFWLGLAAMLAINEINYINTWWPVHTFSIPLTLNLNPLLDRFPQIRHASWRNFILTPQIIPIGVAFAFFMASDVAFSLGVCYLVFEMTTIILVPLGLRSAAKNYMMGSWDSAMRVGSFLGVALILLYTGRRYYSTVLRRALWLKGADHVEPAAVWGLRLAVVCAGGVVAILTSLGLEWPLAFLVVGLLLLIFVVISRMSAESGLFIIRAAWMPVGVLTSLLGPAMLGPQAFMLLAVFCAVMVPDTISSFMPHVVNGLRVCDDTGAKIGKVGSSLLAVLVLGAAVGIPVTMWVNYNYGIKDISNWAVWRVPRLPFENGQQVIGRLKLSGQLEEYSRYGALGRLLHAQPDGMFVSSMILGLALVLAFSMMRLRFRWWPLHPIFLLVWGTWTSGLFYFSFLLGWVIKQAVTLIGGGSAYHRTKPLMIGVIAGNLLADLIRMVVSTVYYLITGYAARA